MPVVTHSDFNSIYYLREGKKSATDNQKPSVVCFNQASATHKFFVCFQASEHQRWYASYEDANTFFKMYQRLTLHEKRFHELIRSDYPRYEFYDIDGERKDAIFHGKSKDEIITAFLLLRRAFLDQSKWKELRDARDVRGLKSVELCIKDGCRDEKVSFHFIIRTYDRFYFANQACQQLFIDDFSRWVVANKKEWATLEGKQIIDWAVYRKDGTMRMLNSYKCGDQSRPHVAYSSNLYPLRAEIEFFASVGITDDCTSIFCNRVKPTLLQEETTVEESVSLNTTVAQDRALQVRKEELLILKIAGKYASDNFELQDAAEGLENLRVLKRLQPSYCIICNRTHDRRDMFICTVGGNVYLHCYCTKGKRVNLGAYRVQRMEVIPQQAVLPDNNN